MELWRGLLLFVAVIILVISLAYIKGSVRARKLIKQWQKELDTMNTPVIPTNLKPEYIPEDQKSANLIEAEEIVNLITTHNIRHDNPCLHGVDFPELLDSECIHIALCTKYSYTEIRQWFPRKEVCSGSWVDCNLDNGK